MRRRSKGQRLVDGFTVSAWKSLAVKALRMGWPHGLEEALARLGRSAVQWLLVTGVFEDIFPAVSEFEQVYREARSLDFAALCRRETHHGRGQTPAFCQLEEQAVEAARTQRAALWAQARQRGLWLPNRALNTFWTWLELRPEDAGVIRTLDRAAWTGIPAAMLDGHTYEGRRLGRDATILSGDYNSHAHLGRRVRRHGWGPIRREVHAERAEPQCHAKQNRLF